MGIYDANYSFYTQPSGYTPVDPDKNTYVAIWDILFSYNQNMIVAYNGNIYRSLINGNLGNQPDISPLAWEMIAGDIDREPYHDNFSTADWLPDGFGGFYIDYPAIVHLQGTDKNVYAFVSEDGVPSEQPLGYGDFLQNDTGDIRILTDIAFDGFVTITRFASAPSGGGGTNNYDDLINKPELDTTATASLPTSPNEVIQGNINLHKISKTGDYNDLNNIPTGILVETVTRDRLLSQEEMTVNHTAPVPPNQIITEMYGLEPLINDTLNFDVAERANYYEENPAKTDFVNDKLQLKEILEVPAPYAWYHFNELSGTLIGDSSGNNRDGLAIGNPAIINGKLDKARNYYALSGQYIDCGEIAAFEYNMPFSVECWVRTTYAGGNHMVVSKMSNSNLELYTGWQVSLSNGQVNFLLRGGGLTRQIQRLSVTTTVNDGNWHHIVCTYDGSNTPTGLHIYVDSVLNDGTTSGTTVTSILTIRPCCIGSRGGGWLFTGDIDELLIYQEVLNQSQVDFRYNGGAGTELIGYYDVTKGWYVRTNTNQIDTSSWSGISQIIPIATLPTGTEIRFLVSVDNRITWKKWNGISWDTVNLANIDTQGNTLAEIVTLFREEWDLLFVAGTLDIVMSLKTTIDNHTPLLDVINVHYLTGYISRIGSTRVYVIRTLATQLKIKNICSEPLYDMSITMLIPQ